MTFVFALCLLGTADVSAMDEPPNLIVNGRLEQGETAPRGWPKPDGVRVKWGKGYGTPPPEDQEGSEIIDHGRGICVSMDKQTAEGYGQGYFSPDVSVTPGEVYTVSVDVKSDGPNAIVFVKGFAKVKDEYREVFSHHKEAHFDRYLGLNRFTNIRFAFKPRHPKYRVRFVRVWLYGYLKPGRLYFDNLHMTEGGELSPPFIPKKTGEDKPAPLPEPQPMKGKDAPTYIELDI